MLDIAQQSYGNKKIRMRACMETTPKYKGVCWCEDRGKWLAQITKGGTYRYLGRFDDEIDAAEAYDNAARELFGEHAFLNFNHEFQRDRGSDRGRPVRGVTSYNNKSSFSELCWDTRAVDFR